MQIMTEQYKKKQISHQDKKIHPKNGEIISTEAEKLHQPSKLTIVQ